MNTVPEEDEIEQLNIHEIRAAAITGVDIEVILKPYGKTEKSYKMTFLIERKKKAKKKAVLVAKSKTPRIVSLDYAVEFVREKIPQTKIITIEVKK